MLNHVDKSVSLVAMLLAPRHYVARRRHVLAYDNKSHANTHAGINNVRVGQWTGATLPQCWLCGALLVLFYRASTILVRPQSCGRAEAQSNCRSVVRLWFWSVALESLQLGTLSLDRFIIGAH